MFWRRQQPCTHTHTHAAAAAAAAARSLTRPHPARPARRVRLAATCSTLRRRAAVDWFHGTLLPVNSGEDCPTPEYLNWLCEVQGECTGRRARSRCTRAAGAEALHSGAADNHTL